MDTTSGLQFSSASFFVLLAGAMERDGTGHKKGLRGLGKRKLAGMHIDLFFFGFTAASTTILLPFPPSFVFLSPTSLRFRAMFFLPHQNNFVASHICTHTVEGSGRTSIMEGERDCVCGQLGTPRAGTRRRRKIPRI